MTTAPARAGAHGRQASAPREGAPAEQGTPPEERPGGRERARRALARLALVALGALGAAIAVGAAGGPSRRLTPSSEAGFPGWFAGPFEAISPGPLPETAFWLLLLAIAACYLAVLALASSAGWRWIAGSVIVLHVVFALAPPLLSTDAFGYVAVARAVAVHGASAYAPLTETLARDPVLPLLVWETRPNSYGPLFTALSVPLAGLTIAGGLWTVKALAAVSSLALVGLVAHTARRLGRDPVAAAAFVGLNPVLLAWAVGGAHNDALLMLLVVGSIALLVGRRERLGGAALAAACAVKASVAVLVPILVLGARRRLPTLAGLALGLLAAGPIALAVLGPSVAGFPAALADQAGLRSPNSTLHLIGQVLGHAGDTPALRMGGAVVLVVALVVLYFRVARGGDPIAAAGWATVATLVTTTWLMPWYVVWVLPLAALAPGRGLRAASLAVCAYVAVMRAPLSLG